MPNSSQKKWFYSHNVLWLLISVAMIIIDQVTKYIAVSKLVNEYNSVPVLPFLSWTLAYNPGAAFSFLSNAGGWQRFFFIGLSGVMSVIFLAWLLRLPKGLKVMPVGLAFLLGGAVGNLIDRLTTTVVNYRGDTLTGAVIDFIHVHHIPSNFHFPIFNVADIAVNIGVALLIIDAVFLEKRRNARYEQ
ncbi:MULTISPECIES: signal peptidase II [unclassified Acinetobacter]|uniref:signal peptidase II n=1 Tax=unclassified Acinetobacter TaxID=196816 RepID=UPI0035BAE80B